MQKSETSSLYIVPPGTNGEWYQGWETNLGESENAYAYGSVHKFYGCWCSTLSSKIIQNFWNSINVTIFDWTGLSLNLNSVEHSCEIVRKKEPSCTEALSDNVKKVEYCNNLILSMIYRIQAVFKLQTTKCWTPDAISTVEIFERRNY